MTELFFVAAFAASERLVQRQRTQRGPGNFPEAHTRSAPCWASCSTSTRWGRSPGSGPR